MARAVVLVLLLLAASAGASTATTLTIHNLCPHPVWPLVTPNSGLPSISDNTARLDPNALLSLSFPAYSVSLVDGFNVPVVVSPQAVGGGQCPALGCPVDLNCDCPPEQRAAEGAACRGPPAYFKNRCPLTRTTPTDVEPVPQSCRAPGELKIVFCQATIVTGTAAASVGAEMVIRSVVADS